MIKHAFNMIEVALAMGVIMLGVVGVLSLMPPAMDATADTSGEVFAQQAAASVIEYLKFFKKNGYNDGVPKVTSLTTPSDNLNTGNYITPDTGKWNSIDSLYKPKTFTSVAETPLIFCEEIGSEKIPRVQVRLYKQAITDNPVNSNISSYTANIERYYIETTWPLEKPYNQRQQRFFVIDFPAD